MNTYDRDFWEARWAEALQTHVQRPPNAHLTAAVGDLPAGRALDAGCGHGSNALWLAAHGWQVTGVDFSATALAVARSLVPEADFVEADLTTWAPEPEAYDLVVCLYVHGADVRRLAAGVAPGGTLFMVGHHPAGGQTQVSVEAARNALDPGRWTLLAAEDRPRPDTGFDAVIRARRVNGQSV